MENGMYLPNNYRFFPIWLTIDVERIEDANFGITPKNKLHIDYPDLIHRWIEMCERHGYSSTAFVLGSFAKKFPQAVKALQQAGHEIACHGLHHDLVYTLDFEKWKEQTLLAKNILQEITGEEIKGYRSPSWTLPFAKRYYETLVQMGFSYSSSYFPFKTYMYGHTIDKKKPFIISTDSGPITEIPIPKAFIPFSGGFYMRILPLFVTKTLFGSLIKRGYKPIIYTHPYELLPNLFTRFFKDVKFDMAYILTFSNTGNSMKRFDTILKGYAQGNR